MILAGSCLRMEGSKHTSCGYVMIAANNFAMPAAPALPVQDIAWSQLDGGLPLAAIRSCRRASDIFICSYRTHCIVLSETPR